MESDSSDETSRTSSHSRSTRGDDGRHLRLQQSHQPKRHTLRWIIWTVVVLVILGLGGFFSYRMGYFSSQIDSTKYQAVFLDNGQVYFGKLHGYYSSRPYLTNVYYIQSQDGTSKDAKNTTSQLVKLGGEVHAPEDEMILNKSSILFVENLTKDSKVVKLIESGK